MGRGKVSLVGFGWLVAVGLLGGLLWRVEVEWHGYGGYGWTGYFHWAMPAMLGLYLGWVWRFGGSGSGVRRWLVMSTLVGVAVGWGMVLRFALYYHFNWGPGAVIEHVKLGAERYRLYAHMIYIVLPLTPLVFALPRWMLTGRWSWPLVTAGVAVILAAVPLSLFVLAVSGHAGGAVALNTIKSGLVWPFALVAIGLPWLRTGGR